jgi:hypothetical protein
LSGIRVANLTQTSGRVYWTTNESSDSYVEYWVTGGAVKSTSSATRVLNHSLSLSFLTRITTYNYRVKSKDAAGNLVTSAVYTFTTKA